MDNDILESLITMFMILLLLVTNELLLMHHALLTRVAYSPIRASLGSVTSEKADDYSSNDVPKPVSHTTLPGTIICDTIVSN